MEYVIKRQIIGSYQIDDFLIYSLQQNQIKLKIGTRHNLQIIPLFEPPQPPISLSFLSSFSPMMRTLNDQLNNSISLILAHKQSLALSQSPNDLRLAVQSLIGQSKAEMLFGIIRESDSNQDSTPREATVKQILKRIDELGAELKSETLATPKVNKNMPTRVTQSNPNSVGANRLSSGSLDQRDSAAAHRSGAKSKNSNPAFFNKDPTGSNNQPHRLKTQSLYTREQQDLRGTSYYRQREKLLTEHSQYRPSHNNKTNRKTPEATPTSPEIIGYIFSKYCKYSLGLIQKNTSFEEKSLFYKTLNYDKIIQFLIDYGARTTSEDRLYIIKIIRKHCLNSKFIQFPEFTKIYEDLKKVFVLQDENMRQYIENTEKNEEQAANPVSGFNTLARSNKVKELEANALYQGSRVAKGEFRRKVTQRAKQMGDRSYFQNSLLEKLRLKELNWETLFNVSNANQYKDLAIPEIDFADEEDQYYLSEFGSKEVPNTQPLKGNRNGNLGKGKMSQGNRIRLPILGPSGAGQGSSSNKRTRSNTNHNISVI